MYSPLLNSFIFICKIVVCISIFVSINTHHWIRTIDGDTHRGPKLTCYDYGHLCYERDHTVRAVWFFYSITLISCIIELINILLLCKRSRSPVNLILEELAVVSILIFLIPASLLTFAAFVLFRGRSYEQLDWSFYVFLLSLIIGLIDLICSLVRVVSYCREHSFRSNVRTYNNNNHELVNLQS